MASPNLSNAGRHRRRRGIRRHRLPDGAHRRARDVAATSHPSHQERQHAHRIPISDIQGVFSAGWSGELCEHLGLKPRYLDTTSVGGCSFQIHVHHALAAIHAGIIDIALVSHGEAGWSYRGGGYGGRGAGQVSPGAEMTAAYGTFGAPSQYAHAMVRHFHRFGTTQEDFAHIAVVTREWAQLNPRAVMCGKTQSPFGGPHHRRGRSRSAPDRLAANAVSLLPGHRSWRRGDRRPARDRQEPAHQSGVDQRRRRVHGAPEHAGNGGFHRHFPHRARRPLPTRWRAWGRRTWKWR